MHKIHLWIALEQCKGVGPAMLMYIYSGLDKYNLFIQDLFDCTSDELKAEFSFSEQIIQAIETARMQHEKVEEDYFQLLDASISVTPFYDSDYPEILKERMGRSAPPFMYSYGNKALLHKKAIAILGDKDISNKGEMITFVAAKELCRHDICIASGYAAGADMIAHRSALTNEGTTIAVVPYGILNLKISQHLEELLNLDKALFISFFYPQESANQFNAYVRNRLVCALSRAVYIVEAPKEGGVFEAAKSADKMKIPLYTTQYGEYPENAVGNKTILEELGGHAIRGKIDNEILVPNVDRLIADAKFS